MKHGGLPRGYIAPTMGNIPQGDFHAIVVRTNGFHSSAAIDPATDVRAIRPAALAARRLATVEHLSCIHRNVGADGGEH